jgi:3-oxoadipate enol-lactonase
MEVFMFIQLDDFMMGYEIVGQDQPTIETTILFIHGFPLNRSMWAAQLSVLPMWVLGIAPDLRGYGDSDPTAGPYTMDLLADDCIALLDALGVKQPVVVCGLSMGGYVTLSLYRRHPERIQGLILAATRAGADSPEGKTNRDNAIAQAERDGAAAIAATMLPKMMATMTYTTNPALVKQVEELMSSASVPGIVGALAGMKTRSDSTAMLNEIEVPTLIIHGEDDQLIPVQEAQIMHTAITSSEMAILSDAGHLVNLEQPPWFNQVVFDFIKHQR